MSSRALTPANQITILRLVFVPVFAILVIERRYDWALAILGIAALSDGLDGLVARIFHQESPLGMALDPIADKILMTTASLALSFRGILPWWFTILVISRDVAILATALLISLVSGYRPFRPSILGKASTAVQVATLFLACAYAARVPHLAHSWMQTLMYLAAVLTGASGVHYLIVCRQLYGVQVSERLPPPTPVDKRNGSDRSTTPGSSSQ